VICRSDGSIYFTDPDLRVPPPERELPFAAVYRIATDTAISLVVPCEYPNGLALSPDESTLYIANTRWTPYVHAIGLDTEGKMSSRRIFAELLSDETPVKLPAIPGSTHRGFPDGLKVDAEGRVWCTGPGGISVFEPDGTRIGVVAVPEVAANLAFGGNDLRTLLITAQTSVYSLRTEVPGQPHPWYVRRS
jgi:gluconolactonase